MNCFERWVPMDPTRLMQYFLFIDGSRGTSYHVKPKLDVTDAIKRNYEDNSKNRIFDTWHVMMAHVHSLFPTPFFLSFSTYQSLDLVSFVYLVFLLPLSLVQANNVTLLLIYFFSCQCSFVPCGYLTLLLKIVIIVLVIPWFIRKDGIKFSHE